MKKKAAALDNLSDRLKAAREAAGLKAKELDTRAGTTKGHVSLIEGKTRKNYEVQTAAKLAHALGVSLDWLISGQGMTDAEALAGAKAHVQGGLAKTGTEG